MRARTLAELSAPLLALRLLGAEFGHMPAPTVEVSPIYPERLDLTFHDDFAAFEAWREALNIAPESVVHRVQTGVLRVHATFAGAEVMLTGYANVPAAGPVLAGSGAVS
ncbi:hypothetical protein PV371_06720 [Streptomyces sp. TX20-6-3]|uniref:hypothetical protein n=1 Tax=Streptomyces sp. TX20-6-3 TaxID=3028705 RepID=UPI0029A76160|nr:hypothetical protein [Streptomyces sp. TX20-6-3]MDX2559340.1 hypothetical protein [Streptomyces sp. TX20-6-3]